MNVLAQIGGIVGAVGLAALLVSADRRVRLAGLGAWGVGLGVLAVTLLPDIAPALLAAAAVGGGALAVGGAWMLGRWPYLLAFLTVACVPLRLPVSIGTERVNLLLPLYLVIAAFAGSLGLRLLGGERRSRELGAIAWPLALFIVWSGVSLLWTDDVRRGSIFMGAFLLPFGLLAVGFARLPWRGRALTWLWGAVVGTALLYAAIGVYQWATRDIFWNPRVIVENAYAPFFRVNSVFWDPSVYGRYLVLAILASLAGILLGGVRGRRIAVLYAAVATTWIGLVLSLSQSSFVALAVGIVVAASVAWGVRATVALGALAVLVLAAAFAVPQVRHEVVGKSRTEIDRVTRGRSDLVGQGVRIALDHPFVGVGAGGFPHAYGTRVGKFAGQDALRVSSHTTPVTVVAEGGVVGFGLYLAILAAALGASLRGIGRGFTSRVSLAIGVCLAAIVAHSMFYAAFFEDPLTWALLGLVGLAVQVPRKPTPA